jgi:hypothetical protein
MEGLLFFRVYPSDGFRFILIPDGNPSHEFPVLDGNPSSNMNSASSGRNRTCRLVIPVHKFMCFFFCVGVMYSGEYDVCDVTLSVLYIHAGQA